MLFFAFLMGVGVGFGFGDPPPELMWTLQFRSGTRLTVRVTTEAPDLRHLMVARHPLDLVARDLFLSRIQEAVRQVSEMRGVGEERSVLVELPGSREEFLLPDWIAEAVTQMIPKLSLEKSLDLHLTLRVWTDFNFSRLQAAIPAHCVPHFGLLKRNLIAGPQSLYRGWETFPRKGQVAGLLPEPVGESPTVPKSIVGEVERLLREARIRSEILGESFPDDVEREGFLAAVRSLNRTQKVRLRAEIEKIRLEAANRISINPVARLYAAYVQSRSCTGTLEQ